MKGRLEQNRSTGRKKQHSQEEYESMEIAKKQRTRALISYCKAQKEHKKKVKTLLANP